MRTAAIAGVALVAIVAVAVLGTYRWASAVGNDVNDDGFVTIKDIFQVAGAFGQAVPLPPVVSPFEGVWEGTNQDWVQIEHESSGVFSIKYYDPIACPSDGRLGLGGGSFEQEPSRHRWYSWYWCMAEPPQPNSFGFCDNLIYDEASDSLTCTDGSGPYHRSEVSWDDIVP